MAFTRIAAAVVQSTTGNTVSTAAIDTTGAKLIVAYIACNTGTPPTFSDSASNVWTAGPSTTSSAPDMDSYYCLSPTTSASHTFTATGTSVYPAVGVLVYSAAGTVTLDGSNSVSGVNVNLNTGSVTPSQDGCVLVAGAANSAGGVVAIDSGFTVVHDVDLVGGQAFGLGTAEQIQTTATTRDATFSGSSGGFTGAAVLVFKAAAAAPSDAEIRGDGSGLAAGLPVSCMSNGSGLTVRPVSTPRQSWLARLRSPGSILGRRLPLPAGRVRLLRPVTTLLAVSNRTPVRVRSPPPVATLPSTLKRPAGSDQSPRLAATRPGRSPPTAGQGPSPAPPTTPPSLWLRPVVSGRLVLPLVAGQGR